MVSGSETSRDDDPRDPLSLVTPGRMGYGIWNGARKMNKSLSISKIFPRLAAYAESVCRVHRAHERAMTTRLYTQSAFFILVNVLFLAARGWAAIGDNAPPIPSTYKTSHPRLPVPDSSYLSSLAANTTALASYNAMADAWDSTNTGNYIQFRRLLLAYMANKIVNPSKAATYLAKIKATADLGGTWGHLIYSVNDGVGNGTYTVTSASANFLTGCGGSCQGEILSIGGRTYNITGVTNANTIVLSPSTTAPSGTNLQFRVFSSINAGNLNVALVYDWLYNDLDSTTRAEFLRELDVLSSNWEANYLGVNASPYNDVFYLDVGPYGLIGALAMYPDHPNGLAHLQFASDVWFNSLLPVWNQVFGPEGGGWHESWPDYVDATGGSGLAGFLVPTLLSWQVATGDPIFTRKPWLKNFGYFTIYMARPDYVLHKIGDTSRPYLISEYDISIGAGFGSLNGLAEIYNDPVLRGWARLVNHELSAGPTGVEPSAWPFYTPDKVTNPVSPLSTLPPIRNFTGWGFLSMRTGWTEDDTAVTIKYGDNFWSHEHADAGAFTIFNRGNLAIDSGSYRPGYSSKHETQYGRQAIAHNTLTITDPADTYSTTFSAIDEFGSNIQIAIPNDGGQRRVGSPYNERFSQMHSPSVLGDWLRNWDYYHTGTMVGFASTSNYTYTAVDITPAYNNQFSAATPNATNRTNRVQKAIRHLVLVPRGKAAYVIVFDQVISTNASFTKRWLLHTINQPTITGNRFQVLRNELVTPKPYIDLWPANFSSVLSHVVGSGVNTKYQYDGKLYGWMVQPQGGTINVVGGAGKEFWIEDPLHTGVGTNWNQCQPGQCATTEGLGSVANFVNPEPGTAPQEPGSWRMEEKPGAAATQDLFLNVMLATTVEDTSVPATVTVPSGLAAGMTGATWVDGGKTYTITFPQSGLGGHVTITGVVDEDLLAHSQQLPAQLQIKSGTPQSGPASASLSSPFVAVVKDSSGIPVPGAAVHFGIIQGNGLLSSEFATTDSQGLASISLTMGTGTVGSVTQVMADVNGLPPIEFDATLSSSSSSGPSLSAISCTPTTLNSGATSTCTVTLSAAAGSGGATVTLSSSSQAVTVPAVVLVPTGSTTATFSATASVTGGGQTAIVTGTLGISQTVSLSVQSSAPSLTSVSCAITSLLSGAASTCTVTLSQAAASATTVTLSSSSLLLTVPASVSVSVGSSTATFTATAGILSIGLTAVVTATLSGISQTATLTLLVSSSGGTPIPLQSWLMVPTQGFPAQTVGYGKIVYAPAPVKRVVMLDNYHELSSEPNQSMVAYDFEANRWDVLDIGASFHSEYMPEAGHPVGGFTYDPALHSFLYYCCSSGSNQAETPYAMWLYDFLGQTGRPKQTSPKPGMILYESASFDSFNNIYVLHGGTSFEGTWTYNPSTNTYVKQSPGGTLPNPSLLQHSMTFNTSDHKVYLFGGQIGSSYSNDLFKYDVPTNTWTQLSPTGTRPAPRWRSAFAYDSTNNVFMLYGGQDGSQVYNDTWIYNPATNAWLRLTPAQIPPLGGTAPFENLAYDSDHNVFVLILTGAGGYTGGSFGYGAQTWFFRYQGTGANVGTTQPNYQATTGSINKHVDAWGKEPSLIGSGSSLYAAWVETGTPFDKSNGTWFHVYVNQRVSGAWAPLGGAPTSLDSEFSGYSESHSPSVAIIGGSPWVSWYKWNNSGQTWAIWAKRWTGTAWQNGAIGVVGSIPAKAYQGPSQIADVGGVPYIAFLETDKSYYPPRGLLYVKSWNGTQWNLTGSGPLNINASLNTMASSVSLASDGTHPYVAWTEYTADTTLQTRTPGQINVARWSGSAWVSVGGALNMNTAAWANDASIAYMNGQPYVAWTETTTAGNNQLFVKTFTGSNWVLVGSGTLNKDTNTGWTFRPSLVADSVNNTLYIGWVEQQNLGQRPQAYVSKLVGSTWTPLGGSLNANSTLGSAQRINLAVTGGQPVAAWGEVNFGSLRQIFAKQWNGSSWSLLTGTSTGPPVSCDVNNDGSINAVDVQLAVNQALGISPCGTADLQQNGQCNVIDVQRVINATVGSLCVIGF